MANHKPNVIQSNATNPLQKYFAVQKNGIWSALSKNYYTGIFQTKNGRLAGPVSISHQRSQSPIGNNRQASPISLTGPARPMTSRLATPM